LQPANNVAKHDPEKGVGVDNMNDGGILRLKCPRLRCLSRHLCWS